MLTTFVLTRALPFALTFLIGSAVAGFLKLFDWRSASHTSGSAAVFTARGDGSGCDYRRKRRLTLAGESKPLVITHKPSAVYTREARRAGHSGTVRLNVKFGPDGKVMTVEPLREQPYGLTISAVKAAFDIEFTPAVEGGKPVPATRVIEYDFPSEQTVDEGSGVVDYTAPSPRR
ncbi:MAG TPA: TonB family protein [Pyrinomonadaceae bacterium]|nr:TonB family protein [Pyrinomonadaceae bacterium]